MLSLPTTLLFIFLSSSLANAGSVQVGGACSITNNKLQLGTYEFTSDCDSVSYCDPNTNQCEKRKCRRDEFPFGYAPGADLPPRCPDGQFCPDEEDGCQDKLPVDSDCQLNRDGKTVSLPWTRRRFTFLLKQMNANLLRILKTLRIQHPTVSMLTELSASTSSACKFYLDLLSTRTLIVRSSRWANITLGLPCVVENTAYISYGANDEYIDIVSRYADYVHFCL